MGCSNPGLAADEEAPSARRNGSASKSTGIAAAEWAGRADATRYLSFSIEDVGIASSPDGVPSLIHGGWPPAIGRLPQLDLTLGDEHEQAGALSAIRMVGMPPMACVIGMPSTVINGFRGLVWGTRVGN